MHANKNNIPSIVQDLDQTTNKPHTFYNISGKPSPQIRHEFGKALAEWIEQHVHIIPVHHAPSAQESFTVSVTR